MDLEPTYFDHFPTEEEPPKAPIGFASLVESALDFLEFALAELKDRPKYSVIHFCVGIELLLKARLLHEHWSLVVSKPGEANKAKFASGDFESVTMRQSFERLENVCGEKLSEERGCFLDLAAHRNRLVHFFHNTYAGNPDPKLLEQIAIQQLKAGALLMRLLRQRWKAEFEQHKQAINDLESSLRVHSQYLEAKLDIIQPQLKQFESTGGQVWECFLCGMKSAKLTDDEPLLKKTRCLVCEVSRNYIRVTCPNCKKCEIDFDVGEGTCGECETSFDLDFLMSEFKATGEAYCPECEYSETESVVEHGDSYLCLACGNEFSQVGECDWCGEEIAGDMSGSYLSGCMFCEGMIGHHKDD